MITAVNQRNNGRSAAKWGFTFKPFADGADLQIHQARLSTAARHYFDFAIGKLDGKRCNRMTIPFTDAEFAERFNYSEVRARHARRECVNAGLFEQHFGRTKNGTRLVGKFCFKLVLPDDLQEPPPAQECVRSSTPPADPAPRGFRKSRFARILGTEAEPAPIHRGKVVESQTDLWSEADRKSGQKLTIFEKSEIPETHVPTEFDEHADPDAIDVVLDVCIEDSLSSIDVCNVNSKSCAKETRERRADKTPKPEEPVPPPTFPSNPVAQKFISECMGRSRVPKEIFQRVAVEMDSTVSDIMLNLGIGHEKAVEVAQNACDALVENIERVRSMKMFDETDYWQKAIDKAKDLFSYPTEDSSSNPVKVGMKHLSLGTQTPREQNPDTQNSATRESKDLPSRSGDSESYSALAKPPSAAEIKRVDHLVVKRELLATWDDDRWLDWVSEHVDKCVRIRQMLCDSPVGADLSPYTDEEISSMRDELLAKYPETDEQRLEWIGSRISERNVELRKSDRQLREPELMAKVSEKWQERFKTPTAYITDYCQRNRHRKTLSPIETTRLFRAVKGQVTPDEIESIQRSCHEDWQWEKKNLRYE